jgi:hypothetical protein
MDDFDVRGLYMYTAEVLTATQEKGNTAGT